MMQLEEIEGVKKQLGGMQRSLESNDFERFRARAQTLSNRHQTLNDEVCLTLLQMGVFGGHAHGHGASFVWCMRMYVVCMWQGN